MDRRREPDTSEEEAEEEAEANFIDDDGTAETRYTVHGQLYMFADILLAALSRLRSVSEVVPHNPLNPIESSPEAEEANGDTGPPSTPHTTRLIRRVTSPLDERCVY